VFSSFGEVNKNGAKEFGNEKGHSIACVVQRSGEHKEFVPMVVRT